jgi:hypothetical protein
MDRAARLLTKFTTCFSSDTLCQYQDCTSHPEALFLLRNKPFRFVMTTSWQVLPFPLFMVPRYVHHELIIGKGEGTPLLPRPNSAASVTCQSGPSPVLDFLISWQVLPPSMSHCHMVQLTLTFPQKTQWMAWITSVEAGFVTKCFLLTL